MALSGMPSHPEGKAILAVWLGGQQMLEAGDRLLHDELEPLLANDVEVGDESGHAVGIVAVETDEGGPETIVAQVITAGSLDHGVSHSDCGNDVHGLCHHPVVA